MRVSIPFTVCLLLIASAGVPASGQSQVPGREVNGRIERLLAAVKADPNFGAEFKTYSELLDIVRNAKPGDIDAQTIEDMAAMLSNSNLHIRVSVAMVLGDIGPLATRAIPALQNAMAEYEKECLAYYCINGGGPGPLDYNAEARAVQKISGSR